MKHLVLALCLIASFTTLAKVEVKVGIYEYPPFVFISDKTTGMAVDLLELMNTIQDDFNFVVVPTTAKRRYIDFAKNKFDMMLFENINWGWQEYPLTASQPYSTGTEVYVSYAIEGRGQSFFTDFKNKVMVGVLGYHYQFSEFQTDQAYLENNFTILQTGNQQQSLNLILNNRGEIAVLSKEFLFYHFMLSPEDKNRLLISDKPDQIYHHHFLVRDNTALSVEVINILLTRLKKDGALSLLWARYGLDKNSLR